MWCGNGPFGTMLTISLTNIPGLLERCRSPCGEHITRSSVYCLSVQSLPCQVCERVCFAPDPSLACRALVCSQAWVPELLLSSPLQKQLLQSRSLFLYLSRNKLLNHYRKVASRLCSGVGSHVAHMFSQVMNLLLLLFPFSLSLLQG